MTDINTICVIGGDKRQIYMGLSFIKDGYNVIFYGVDKCGLVEEDYSSLLQAVKKSDCVVLPIPLTKDGEHIFSPLTDELIPINEEFSQIPFPIATDSDGYEYALIRMNDNEWEAMGLRTTLDTNKYLIVQG